MLALLLLLASPIDDVKALGDALATRDVAKAYESFTPDASVTLVVHASDRKRVPDEVYVGPDAVRDFLIAHLPGWEATAKDVTAERERVTWKWSVASERFRKLGIDKLDASVDASVRAGKIRSLVLTPSPEQQAKFVLEIPDANEAVVRSYVDRMNGRDYHAIDDLLASTFQNQSYMPMGPGVQGLKDFYKEFSRAFPDFKFTIEDIFSEGDRVAVRMTARYTHKGEFMGIEPTNNAVVITKFDIFRFSGGRIVEHWDSVDRLGLLNQLGVLPKIPRWSATPGSEGFR